MIIDNSSKYEVNPLIKYELFSGINTWDDPVELDKSEFVSCIDFDISNVGKLYQRAGRTLVKSGTFSNIFTEGQNLIGLVGNDLCIVDIINNNTTVICKDFGDGRISNVSVNDVVFVTNKTSIGLVRDGVYYTLPFITTPLKAPLKPGQLIEFYKGRLFIANGKVVTQSDPIAVRFAEDENIVSGGNTRQFATEVTMMKAVTDGMWYGDETGIYFCLGDDISAPRKKYSDSIPLLNMFTKLNPLYFKEPKTGIFYDIATTDAVYRIGDSGYIENLTYKKYRIESITAGCMTSFNRRKINQTIIVFNQ